MDEKLRKKSIYFIIGLALVMASYQHFMNYKPFVETERYKAYLETNNQAVNASDSIYIKAFYDKLCFVFQTVSNDTLKTKAFSNIDKSKLPKDFKTHLCTRGYLDFLCEGPHKRKSERRDLKEFLPWYGETEISNNLDKHLGLDAFSYNISNKIWKGSVKSEIGYFEKDTYLMVVEFSEMIPPNFHEKTDSYDAGYCKGNVKVVNITTGELAAAMTFFAQNDESIKSYHLVKYAMDDKLKDNLSINIHKALNRCALALFGMPLNQKETEMYE
jgi:hypothetical protein